MHGVRNGKILGLGEWPPVNARREDNVATGLVRPEYDASRVARQVFVNRNSRKGQVGQIPFRVLVGVLRRLVVALTGFGLDDPRLTSVRWICSYVLPR